MWEPSNLYQSVPPQYRIGLALSTAVLLHTIVLSFVSAPIEQPDGHRNTVRFELIPSVSSPESPAATASEVSSRNPHFEIPPLAEKQPFAPTKLTTTANTNKINKALQAKKQSTSEQISKYAQQTDGPSVSESVASPSQVNNSSAPGLKDSLDDVNRRTNKATLKDPYTAKLTASIGRELENIWERSRVVIRPPSRATTFLELHLQPNGTLTKARILKSSGTKQWDQVLYQATLAASPYPEPPQHLRSQGRFEIEITSDPEQP